MTRDYRNELVTHFVTRTALRNLFVNNERTQFITEIFSCKTSLQPLWSPIMGHHYNNVRHSFEIIRKIANCVPSPIVYRITTIITTDEATT